MLASILKAIFGKGPWRILAIRVLLGWMLLIWLITWALQSWFGWYFGWWPWLIGLPLAFEEIYFEWADEAKARAGDDC
jgi:hypothetical protein